MRSLTDIFKRLLSRYFDLIPVPGSFKKLTSGQVLPIIVTQSGSLLIDSLIASFARRSGCESCSLRFYLTSDTPRDLLCSVDMQNSEQLEELLSANNRTLYFSTLNIFRGKGPVRSHPSYSMKFMDFIALLAGPILRCRFLLIVFGDPMKMPELEYPTAHKLQRHFKLDFYRNLKMVRGTPFQKFSVQEQIVLGGRDYDRTINKLSKKLDLSPKQLHKQATKSFRKIAARPRAWVFIPAAIIFRFILRRLFTAVEIRGLQDFAQALKHDTVVLIPMHRSHLDYILIGSVLYEANLNPPLIAAGFNLSFWPAGTIIRALGGYFVKRSARHDRVNSLVLKRYINYLVKRGHLQEFFIEGGRSRSGRMRTPKLGLLKTMISSYLRKDRRDVLFVPVSISYEHVIEDNEYAKENTGRDKIEESLISLFRARKMLRQKYKEVNINFGEPLRFSEFKKSHEEREEKDLLVEELGHEVVRLIESNSNIGLRSLTCLSLFLTPTYGLERKQLTNAVKNLTEAASWYRTAEGNEAYAQPTEALKRFLETTDDDSHDFQSAGVVSRTSFKGSELIYIPGNIRYTAEFYKNSVFHIFVPLGFFSLLQSLGKPVTPEGVRPWFDQFSAELLLPKWSIYKKKLEDYHAILVENGILTEDSKGEFRFSSQGEKHLIPGLLFALTESALWVLHCLENAPYVDRPHPHDPTRTRRVYDYSQFIKIAQQQHRSAKYAGRFTRTEVSSLAGLTSTLEGMATKGLISFQERFGKRNSLILEHPYTEQLAFLNETHEALQEAMKHFPRYSTSDPKEENREKIVHSTHKFIQ